jgi:hypothetical protein
LIYQLASKKKIIECKTNNRKKKIHCYNNDINKKPTNTVSVVWKRHLGYIIQKGNLKGSIMRIFMFLFFLFFCSDSNVLYSNGCIMFIFMAFRCCCCKFKVKFYIYPIYGFKERN